MTGYLLDTNAISMFSPSRASATQAFCDWMDEQEKVNGIYLSAMTIHEIEKGVHLLQHRGATVKAAGIRFWLKGLVSIYGHNILPLDRDVAVESGQLEALAVASGHNPGAADAVIAGTAKFHRLTVITHNLKHFQPFGVAAQGPDQVGV
ncbi:type II toxin-antitoxin system VapC family toxin [Rhizobium tubonense]|uniref:Ribonuclease VapC n=1 Tax=Rhizobium tubonense TaxID=484088 RepID=A0A2W4D196_9HYPH|nr:type II toxin-antitoxin system VapC family toxin [Rhizobium tubonense]PZM17201.1 VapC toxin family PIN domain ribonuclease [Rhizobium tubonense]